MTNNVAHNSGRVLAVVAYITIIGVLVAHFLNQDKAEKSQLITFHVKQALGLWLLFFFLGIVISGFGDLNITYSLWIFFSVLFIYGVFGAIAGKANKIPLLGDLFQKWFKVLD